MPVNFCLSQDLIANFKQSYAGVLHSLEKVYVGLPFSTDIVPHGPIKWRALRVNMGRLWDEIETTVNAFAKDGKRLLDMFNRTGKIPEDMGRRSHIDAAVGDDDASDGSDAEQPAQREKKPKGRDHAV